MLESPDYFFRVREIGRLRQTITVVNPRCACAARVTVVGFVILSVKRDLTSRMSNRAISERAYSVAYERQKICGDFPETTAFKSYAEKHERKSQYAN